MKKTKTRKCFDLYPSLALTIFLVLCFFFLALSDYYYAGCASARLHATTAPRNRVSS